MKRLFTRMLFAILSMASCSFMLYFSWTRIHHVEEIICHFDPYFSDETKKHIEARAGLLHELAPDELIAQLLREFSSIASINFELRPNKQSHVSINSQVPLVCVNDSLVLTNMTRLISQSDFASSVITPLASIEIDSEVASDSQQLMAIRDLMKDIDSSILQRYLLFWHKEHEVTLLDRLDSSIRLICCAHQLQNSESIFSYAEQIKQLVLEREKPAAKKGEWVADVRFEKQVILRGSKGGIHHGTRLS